jgi:hypothetical protein
MMNELLAAVSTGEAEALRKGLFSKLLQDKWFLITGRPATRLIDRAKSKIA